MDMKKHSLCITAAAVAALVLLAVLLVPMLMIAQYDVPINDDYSYGQNTVRVWNSTRDVAAVLKAALQMVRFVYYNWQGSYSAVFLMSLQPGIFGIQAFGVQTCSQAVRCDAASSVRFDFDSLHAVSTQPASGALLV